MSATDVLNPPTSSSYPAEANMTPVGSLGAADGVYGSLPGLFPVPASEAGSKAGSWMKTSFAASSMLDTKVDAQDVVNLDNYVQPVDRGPAAGGPDIQRLLRTWQYQATGKLAAAAVLSNHPVDHIKNGGPSSIQQEACRLIEKHDMDDTFYVVDLGNVLRMFKAWRAAMPRIVPFYAVKCYPEPCILKLLIALGTGFDCASQGECDMMLKLGVHPSKIIFAHPCKRPSDIRYAKERGIQYTTFDTVSELQKIAQMNPGFKCVLRIRADDPDARVPLGLKYGADEEDCSKLLQTAKELGLQVVGVSFHVGSACKNLATFTTAIEQARKIFDEAESLGYTMELLDIGGGFTGHFDSMGNVMFGEIAGAINAAVAQHFPPESGVRIIAEPGRYFAETAATLMTPVYGHRDRRDATTGNIKQKDYWLTDGLYGSFNCIIYDGQNPEYKVVRSPHLPTISASDNAVTFPSTLWGPTCDSADVIYKDQPLPQLRNGDWLMFPNAGAYTVAGACDFNGIIATRPNTYYVFSDSAVDAVDEEFDMEELMA